MVQVVYVLCLYIINNVICPCVCPVYMSKTGTWFFPVSGKEIWDFFEKVLSPELFRSHKTLIVNVALSENFADYYLLLRLNKSHCRLSS